MGPGLSLVGHRGGQACEVRQPEKVLGLFKAQAQAGDQTGVKEVEKGPGVPLGFLFLSLSQSWDRVVPTEPQLRAHRFPW